MVQLSWQDLFTDDPSFDIKRLVDLWPNTLRGRLRPIGMSAFGDIYFERETGHVERLDVLERGTTSIADSREQFASLMNTPQWQETNLLSRGVELLVERGLRRQSNQCFAFAPHPIFVGKLDWDRVMLMDAFPWHSICSQLLDSGNDK